MCHRTKVAGMYTIEINTKRSIEEKVIQQKSTHCIVLHRAKLRMSAEKVRMLCLLHAGVTPLCVASVTLLCAHSTPVGLYFALTSDDCTAIVQV